MTEHRTFLFAGGGTGGHLFPGIAVARALQNRLPQSRFLFVGTERKVERDILQREKLEHVPLPAPPSAWLLRHPWRFVRDYRRSVRIAAESVRQDRPAAVIGLGGFASVPVIRAAHRAGIPVVLLEQNAVCGRATQWLSPSAAAVCHSFPQAVPNGRRGRNCIVTGNPVRPEIAALANVKPTESPGEKRPVLLVLGGSQGAHAVNMAVQSAVHQLCPLLKNWEIVHQSGQKDRESLQHGYAQLGLSHRVGEFFTDMAGLYRTADLIVARAGGTTLAELSCAGVPAVLIPLPDSVRDHQRKNAAVFAEAGAVVVVEQKKATETTGQKLASALQSLLTDKAERRRRIAAMRSLARPAAAGEVAEVIVNSLRLL